MQALPVSPASERNKQPILEQLRLCLPGSARVLEIASGTGQHVVHFAAALPEVQWQPTDAAVANLATIDARRLAARLPNVATPLLLDVHDLEWQVPRDFDAVLCINMIHIAPWSATHALFDGARRHLRDTGPSQLLLYGPYRQSDMPTAASNQEFDASLRSRDPDWGLRHLDDVGSEALRNGFALQSVTSLPANNLFVIFAR